MADRSFTLSAASAADSPRLAEISATALASDLAVSLYYPSRAEFAAELAKMVRAQVGQPQWAVVKAVDDATGRVGAFASWLTVQYSAAELAASDGRAAAAGDFDAPAGFAAFNGARRTAVTMEWAGEREHMQLRMLFTDPAFQRRGMGAALVQRSNEAADAAGLPVVCWASPAGHPLYTRHGFELHYNFDMDLREWAPGGKDNDRGYGNYRFRCLVRSPRAAQDVRHV